MPPPLTPGGGVDGDEFFNNLAAPASPMQPTAPAPPPAPLDDGMDFFSSLGRAVQVEPMRPVLKALDLFSSN